MKKKMCWPEAMRDIIGWLVVGWIICSVSSCTSKSIQAKSHMMENIKGTTIW